MTTRLTLAIQERFDKLSPSERKLAALLLDRADDMLTFSATAVSTCALCPCAVYGTTATARIKNATAGNRIA